MDAASTASWKREQIANDINSIFERNRKLVIRDGIIKGDLRDRLKIEFLKEVIKSLQWLG